MSFLDSIDELLLLSLKGVLVATHGAFLLANDRSCIVLYFENLVEL